MSHYASGRRKEWQARKELERLGASLVVRSAGSKGLVDLVALIEHTVYLVQVKYCRRGVGWEDRNWRKLRALKLAPFVQPIAIVYRRGIKQPTYHIA